MFQRNKTATLKAFTLIELLIVVAIIAILAAIAVPNFLAAQTRSKVSRVLSDIRSLRTAVEAYTVDNNRVPTMSWGPFTNSYGPGGEQLFGTLTELITTPIQYITTQPFDPFAANTSASYDAKIYTYQTPDMHRALFSNNVVVPVQNMPGWVYVPGNLQEVRDMERAFGKYALLSVGPLGDQQFYAPPRGVSTPFWMQYDPTNGTISGGTIFVTQKFFEPTYVDPLKYPGLF